MRKLIMTKGLPGSGKTTWAKDYQKTMGAKVAIICKDDIRRFLASTGWEWSRDAEKDVIKLQNSEIKSAFAQGNHTVIVADTNFGIHEARLRGLAQYCEAEFQIKDFSEVPLEQCIAQDKLRPEEQQVGPEVIKEMYNKYLAGQIFKRYVPDLKKPAAIICDLDGTLALHQDRSPYDYAKVDTDKVNEPIAGIVRTYALLMHTTILYVSGREDVCRERTAYWLTQNRLPVDTPHMLLMRKAKDNRKDSIVKQEIFDHYIREHYNVKFVLDDRNQVVEMWRKLGLTCLQVAEGAF